MVKDIWDHIMFILNQFWFRVQYIQFLLLNDNKRYFQTSKWQHRG